MCHLFYWGESLWLSSQPGETYNQLCPQVVLGKYLAIVGVIVRLNS
jgi:hypothetical protein